MIKKTKKQINKKEDIKETVKPIVTKSVQIPLAGVIVFTFLLAASSFFAGAAWLKVSKTNTSKTATATFAPTKSDKPDFQFYVMSFCPYGNQMETLLKPVFDLLGKSANIKPQYIFEKISDISNYCKQTSGDPTQCAQYIQAGYFTNETDCKKTIAESSKTCLDEKNYLKIGNNLYSSLHGRVEANQDVREICAYNMNEDKTNWWKFIENVNAKCTATNADTCWEEQAKQAGFDTNKITECFNTQAAELIDKEIALTTENKIQGSPTLKVNGADFPPEAANATGSTLKIGKKVFTQAQFRTSDAIKEAICASFKKAPKECKTTIKDATASTEEAGNDTAAAAPASGSCN